MNIGSVSTYHARSDVYLERQSALPTNPNGAGRRADSIQRERQAQLDAKRESLEAQREAAERRGAKADNQAQAGALASTSMTLGGAALLFAPVLGIPAALHGTIGLLGSLFGGLALKFPDIFGPVGKFLNGAIHTLGDAVSDAADGVKKAAEAVGDTAKKAAEAVGNAVTDTAKSVGKAISSLF